MPQPLAKENYREPSFECAIENGLPLRVLSVSSSSVLINDMPLEDTDTARIDPSGENRIVGPQKGIPLHS